MTSEYIQTIYRSAKGVDIASSESNSGLPAGVVNILGKVVDRLRRRLVDIDRKHRLEFEHRQAIAHLESLTDEQLRDIGIARPDIERAVRYGRDQV